MIRVVFFDLGDTLVGAHRAWLPGAKALLSSLKRQRLRLGILSNTTGLRDRQAILDILPTDFDLGRFDPPLVLFSSEVGMEKPDKAIFEAAVARAAIAADACLYCSESLLETLVAQHVGMRSIRVQTSPNSDLASIPSVLAAFTERIR